MYVYTHKDANHATSVRQAFEFQDGTVGLRFQFEKPTHSLKLNFADMDLKSVHAGHHFKVTISTNKVELCDQKTGEMDLKIRQARKELKYANEKIKSLLATKKKSFPVQLVPGQWYEVRATVSGDQLSCSIDGLQHFARKDLHTKLKSFCACWWIKPPLSMTLKFGARSSSSAQLETVPQLKFSLGFSMPRASRNTSQFG